MLVDLLRKQIIENGNIPNHIAIIMDGNGRWAKEKILHRFAGHREGINSVREITRVCGEIDVKHLTLYTFSSENWSRPKTEVSALMTLLLKTINKEVQELHKNNVRLTSIGALEDLPKNARQGILDGIEKTKNNTGLNLVLALSYGGRQEILKAVKQLCVDLEQGKVKSADVNTELFRNYLYTADTPDPELLIRTSGENRISNFLLWQISYAELFISDKLWPDFKKEDLLEAIQDFSNRERRYGEV
mgnify:CR=1 FL=1